MLNASENAMMYWVLSTKSRSQQHRGEIERGYRESQAMDSIFYNKVIYIACE